MESTSKEQINITVPLVFFRKIIRHNKNHFIVTIPKKLFNNKLVQTKIIYKITLEKE